MGQEKKYDVGIYGLWYGNNYGSMITYYALNCVLQGMGRSTVMIRNPLGNRNLDIDSLPVSHQLRFAKNHYEITPFYSLGQMHELNKMCDTFLVGSDQMWNYHLSRPYQQSYFLDFADREKNMISYATSFGHYPYNGPKEELEKIRRNLARFHAISVRDNFSLRILQENMGLKAEQKLDPVFLCKREDYEKLIAEEEHPEDSNYIFAYIMDPRPEIGNSLRAAIDKTGKKLKLIFDKGRDKPQAKENLALHDERVEIIEDPTLPQWLNCFRNSDLVMTDSFHGTCFSIIFEKEFVTLRNNGRGGARFTDLLEPLGLMSHMVERAEDMVLPLDRSEEERRIDYVQVFKRAENMKQEALAWLKGALDLEDWKKQLAAMPVLPPVPAGPPPEVERLHGNPEFVKIRILATLLRDYGVRHVVLSPGGRDVPLVRMFEYNDDSFVLHRVTDERSAAYFGLGIASRLQRPVACVCTSGTAASNYLPAVTEAYFTGVPLIMITADRHEVYHGQGEDQTIPQRHIYDGVVKKSITITEAVGYNAEYQTRRDVSDCILETTHNGLGPVHINIALANPFMGSKVERSYWKLLPRFPHRLMRVSMDDGEATVMRWVDSLRRSPRILVVYGQNVPPTEKQQAQIELFAKKYNCVFIADTIGNLDSPCCLKPHNMLRSISQQEFNDKLTPDILITVGGKRLMNDPLTVKVRGGSRSIRHWDVTPSGRVKDFYFRESSILEMSQDFFFEWFAAHAGDVQNNGEYFNQWKKLAESYPNPVVERFYSQYVQSRFLPSIPENSFLHLGVGETFITCRRYPLQKGVEAYCNMGTNGIDGCTSTFMGQCAVEPDRLCFLMVGDLSFFYDMNSIWNKKLTPNMRIIMVNNNGTGLLRNHNLRGISSVHNTEAKGWVESTGFEYISARNKDEFEEKLPYFISDKPQRAVFFEVIC